MKFNLGYWWPFAQTAWGWTVATIGGLAAIYYGPRKMLETYDWYMDRFFDHKIQSALDATIEKSNHINPDRSVSQWAKPRTVKEIIEVTGYPEKRVRAGLKRLKRKKSVLQVEPDSWKANVPSYF